MMIDSSESIESTVLNLENPPEQPQAWMEDGFLRFIDSVECPEDGRVRFSMRTLAGERTALEQGLDRLNSRNDATFKQYAALLRLRSIDVRVRRVAATRSAPALWVRAEQGFHRPSVPRVTVDLLPTDYVLDLGANTGGFTALVAPHAASVLAVEPEPSNASMWRVNCQHRANCRLVQAAVVGGHDDRQSLPLHLSTNGFCNSVHPKKRGGIGSVEVPTVQIRSLLDGVTVLKCDVEGAEYGLDLLGHIAYRQFRVLFLEFHSGVDGWREKLSHHVIELNRLGYECLRDPTPPKFNSYYEGLWVRR